MIDETSLWEILSDLASSLRQAHERIYELEQFDAHRRDRLAHLSLRLTGGGRSFDPYYEKLIGK